MDGAAHHDAGGLRRELGLFGAVMLGLGAMVGAGVFVSIGVAAGVAGAGVLLAIPLAAALALCNGLSSAQLAAAHPVSGGTYEYGYRLLHPALGFSAGWLFLCAKSASAATAALGFAGYLAHMTGLAAWPVQTPLALGVAALVTMLALAGMRWSNKANIIIVGVAIAALCALIAFGLAVLLRDGSDYFRPLFRPPGGGAGTPLGQLFHASALIFVAFTGYGRIATLGEEVRDPGRIIPRAILVTVGATTLLYLAVAFVAVGVAGPLALSLSASDRAAPLDTVTEVMGTPGLGAVVAVGALAALLGVLLNLILGLSRVALAMGRRGDLPRALGRVDAAGVAPRAAVIAVGLCVAALTLLGDVRLTWSFSAFTVLMYYAITNLAALQLPPESRRYSPKIAWAGLAGCLALAFWVPWTMWMLGLGMLGAALLARRVARG